MMFWRSTLAVFMVVLSSLELVQSASLKKKLQSLSSSARDVLRTTIPAAPHFVTYSDKYVSIESALASINVS